LWDIVNAFPLKMLLFYMDVLEHFRRSAERIAIQRHGGSFLPPEDVEKAQTVLPAIRIFFKQLGFQMTVDAIERLALVPFEGEDIVDISGPMYIAVAAFEAEMQHIQDALRKDLDQRAYVYIVPSRVSYLLKDHLFGEPVSKAFPKAIYDMCQAGNCFAVDANTATIFHLMRVAEHGLRALAYDRRIKVPKKPFDLATWDEIIRKLEGAEEDIRNYPTSHAREAQYRFYHGAMMDARSFKNIWRNPYMHTRAGLNEDDDRREAERIMARVREFMQILATVFAKRKRTPNIWKRAYNEES